MQQRQLRLGDILDDYCPRERRVTNHAVVAMVGSEVKQTRCTTCDTEHEYKGAKAPPQRKKKDAPPALYKQVLAGASKGATAAPFGADQEPGPPSAGRLLSSEPVVPPESPGAAEPTVAGSDGQTNGQPPEEGPVHRPLIRATLPRTEGNLPARQIPEFTVRQNGGRPGKFRATTPPRHRPAGGGSGHAGGGPRHAGRSGMPGGHSSNRSSSPHQHRPAHHPHSGRVARPGKKRSR
jgi:hypothetical protein